MQIYHDIIQGTPEWFQLRLGSIGGSSIASAVAKGQGKMRKNLLYRLAGEILSGKPYDGFVNQYMIDGKDREEEARDVYQAVSGNEIDLCGLVKESDHKHYSPDGWINPNGILEIKNRIPSVHIETILQNEIPSADRKQCQWGLKICQCDYVDYVSYCPEVFEKPIWIIPKGRDEKLIKKLNEGVDKFIDELLSLVEKVRNA